MISTDDWNKLTFLIKWILWASCSRTNCLDHFLYLNVQTYEWRDVCEAVKVSLKLKVAQKNTYLISKEHLPLSHQTPPHGKAQV